MDEQTVMKSPEYVDLTALKAKAFGKEHPEFNDGLDMANWYEHCINDAPVLHLVADRPWIACKRQQPQMFGRYEVTLKVTGVGCTPKTWRIIREMTFNPDNGSDGWVYPEAYHKMFAVAWRACAEPYAGE